MNTTLKIFLVAILFITVATSKKICSHLGFGQAKSDEPYITAKSEVNPSAVVAAVGSDTNLSENVSYAWDEQLSDWVPVDESPSYPAKPVSYSEAGPSSEISWMTLMDITYELRYFKQLDMEIYAPVFTDAVKALDGKEVTIEGFVIPFDKELEILALSANPYASCFFCGKASPASVISLYLKDEGKRYKMDDYIKFKGTLHLNYDDPDEFYYILRNAREE